MLYKGTVLRLTEKNIQTKRGPGTLYSLILNTPVGEVMLGTGFDKPNAPVGAVVSIEAEENSKGYLDADVKTLQVLKEESSPAPQTGAVSQGVSVVDQRQRSIVAQSSYKTAVEAMNTMITHGVLKIPTTKSAKNDPYEVYMGALEEVAQRIFDRTLNGLTLSDPEDQEETTEEGEYDPLS